MNRRNNVYRLLGLARRAGAVAPGTEAVRRAIRVGEARLVLMAGDASRTQLDKIRRTLHDRPIPQAHLGNRDAPAEIGPTGNLPRRLRDLGDRLQGPARHEPADQGA